MRPFSVFYKGITDVENNATVRSGKDLKSTSKWDHNVLKVTTSTVTEESYSLAPDGTLMAKVATPGLKPITLVFERK